MSMRYLGDNFDIHGGGRDLIFPHHENEVAQSECATGKPFANYWIHNGLLTINGEKMSKSLGNYVSIKDVLARYPSDVLKIFFLGAHYSHPIDFTWEKMEAARNAYERILILFDRINREEGPLKAITSGGDTGNKDIFNLKQRFEEAMDDNFNTPVAIGALFDLVNLGNKILEKRPQLHQFMVKYAADILTELGGVLGLSFKTASNGLSDKEIQKLVGARIEAKKSGDFKEADRIREELKQKGIILEDDKDRTHWRRKV